MSSLDPLIGQVRQRITQAVPARDSSLRAPVLDELALRAVALTDGEVETDALLVQALVRAAAESMTSIGQLDARRLELSRAHEVASSPDERRALLREQLAVVSIDRVQLTGDLAATRRWLDLDALSGRLLARTSIHVDQVHMAYVAARSLVDRMDEAVLLTLDSEPILDLAFEHFELARHEIVRVETLELAAALSRRFRLDERLMTLGPHRLRRALQRARDASESVWVRVAATQLVAITVGSEAFDLLGELLRERDSRDGMILRNNVLRLLADSPVEQARRVELIQAAVDDPSEHVRQGLARALRSVGGAEALDALASLARRDDAERVRAYALRELARAAGGELAAAAQAQGVLEQVVAASSTPDDGATVGPLELEVALREIRSLCCCPEPTLVSQSFVEPLQRVVDEAAVRADLLERAATLLVELEVHGAPGLYELGQRLLEGLKGLGDGRSCIVELLPETSSQDLAKALLVATRGDLTVSMQPCGTGRYRLTRGERRGFRLWRLLHEISSPAPDKRQAFAHTKARVPSGSLTVARPGMGEVTPTRVPGERRWLSSVHGWGEFVPLCDDLLAACRWRSRERRIVTGFGTLVLRAPARLLHRLWLRLWVSLRYASLAAERDRALQASDARDRRAFAERVRALGFELYVEHTAGVVGSHSYEVRSPMVPRYLGEGSSAAVPLWLEGLTDALLSPTGNTAWHLAIVAWLAFCGMIIRGAWIRSRMEAARRKVPLTIGGWGSRGKSGSERIKTALFQALRYDVVVKTTGCEAMLIHARRDLPAHELFVYRPYDKATIWEQHKVLHYGAQLEAQVFLWECMALRPQFVQVLEQEWMRSPITTLTNAYPDHEDVMGPSGEDVARVIATFQPPEGGVVFTAEEQMLPIIEAEAAERGNELHAISALDAELLPADLLERFPYAEHPKNIAMVLALGEHLGVDREWALVKMADHVVADLGVLKTYPTVPYRTRQLTFTNGMSANERAGFLSNWTRLGFHRLDPDQDADTVVVAVVNNRADRVPRSRVFADLLTADVVTDHMVLIGTNLAGLQQFLAESLDRWLASLSLGKGDDAEARQTLDELLRRLRLLHRPETLARRVALVLQAAGCGEEATRDICTDSRLLAAEEQDDEAIRALIREACQAASEPPESDDLGLEPEALRRHLDGLLDRYRHARRGLSEIRDAIDQGQREQAEKRMRRCFREQWLRRVHVVTDAHAKGDAIIEAIARQIPPGHQGRLLGCQNIKGTGLDFAYRWVSVGVVHGALQRLQSEPAARAGALQTLAAHGDYGLVDGLDALATIRRLQTSADEAWEPHQAQLAALEPKLAALVDKKRAALAGPARRGGWLRALSWIEPWIDHLDSIRRQRTAKRVMADLVAQRISQARAALMLREVTARGKGGWMGKDLQRWLGRRQEEQD